MAVIDWVEKSIAFVCLRYTGKHLVLYLHKALSRPIWPPLSVCTSIARARITQDHAKYCMHRWKVSPALVFMPSPRSGWDSGMLYRRTCLRSVFGPPRPRSFAASLQLTPTVTPTPTPALHGKNEEWTEENQMRCPVSQWGWTAG